MVFGVKVTLEYSHSAGELRGSDPFSLFALQMCGADDIAKKRTHGARLYFPKMAVFIFPFLRMPAELVTFP